MPLNRLVRLRDWSLRRRLQLLIGVSAGLTAAACLVTLVLGALWIADQRAHTLTAGLTRMMADAVRVPLAQDDAGGVAEALTMLHARGQIRGAWVLRRDGSVVARFGASRPPDPGSGGVRAGYVVASAPVREGDAELGQVVLQSDLGDILSLIGTIVLAIGLAVVSVAWLSVILARRIARGITEPVEQLARTAIAVARSHDTSQRLPPPNADEIGQAMAAFNHMLAELQRRELQHERDRAEAASQAKTSFLSHMSHELRTPLNAVIGAAQLLDVDRLIDPAQVQLVGAIRDSGTRLLGLIDDILDLSRIESGALTLVSEDFDLAACVDAALSTVSGAAAAKGLACRAALDPALPRWRRGDGLRLRQVLVNLLGNAVKFTSQGEVTLAVTAGDGPDRLHFEVQDTGIGIDEATCRIVFEPFQQADSSTSRRFGGTGLGLAISRQLVRAMGGEIELHSQPGQGTCVQVQLPLPSRAAPAPAAAPPAPLPQPLRSRVLVVEDEPLNQLIVQTMLSNAGCTSAVATSGVEALQHLSTQAFDLVLMDWQMPGMDGLEVTRRLRAGECGERGRSVPIVALTANAFREDRETCLAAGMNDYLTKPVELTQLLAALQRWAPVRVEARAEADAAGV